MALGKTPRGTIMFMKRIQGFSNPKKSNSEFTRWKSSLSQLTEEDRLSFLTCSRSKKIRKQGKFRDLPGDIPQGCLAVYVGTERSRYVISTNFLTHPLFKELLKKSEEEFGFEYEGGLNIACEPALFEHLLWMIISKNPLARTMHLQDLFDSFEEAFW